MPCTVVCTPATLLLFAPAAYTHNCSVLDVLDRPMESPPAFLDQPATARVRRRGFGRSHAVPASHSDSLGLTAKEYDANGWNGGCHCWDTATGVLGLHNIAALFVKRCVVSGALFRRVTC
ncbi:hypothetical protein ANO14919_018080 [Xylariales sp. No.14919]|nr:hypothetical protein ANO14919_018080 [Xylariales sp. No.14919]